MRNTNNKYYYYYYYYYYFCFLCVEILIKPNHLPVCLYSDLAAHEFNAVK